MKNFLLLVALFVFSLLPVSTEATASDFFDHHPLKRGMVVLLDVPQNDVDAVIAYCQSNDVVLYVQTDDAAQLKAIQTAADKAGLLGQRIFADTAELSSIQIVDNLADLVLVAPSAEKLVSDEELLRVLHPQATAFIGSRKLTKQKPAGVEDWTHPYHGPDNNPQTKDQLARGKLRTQFIGYPKFSPMPEQSVIGGGRIYKAMGHIAHKANQFEWLNTLVCINAYNGTILWRRPLPKGFMIHRNTMIATDDALLLGDDKSCKIIDGATGKTRDELVIPKEISDGPVWKWMAYRDGILYGLVGNVEIKVDTQKSARRGIGHWPWDMWQGHDYKDPKTAFGYGRTLVAYNLKTKKRIWEYRDEEFLDARAICMNNEQIFFYVPEKFLAAVDLQSGKQSWKNSGADLLEAIGKNQKAQLWKTGYSTSCYLKCNEKQIFFAGPQRLKMVVASATDGKLQWTYETGNVQLVLRDDAIYAAGPLIREVKGETGVKLAYEDGKILAGFPSRRACTRATGAVDSIFYRANGGTVRVMTDGNNATHLDPMRPPCQDGVLISNGHFYWGPWMCGCQLSLYGNICLAPASDQEHHPPVNYHDGLITYGGISKVEPLPMKKNDWLTYRGTNARNDETQIELPSKVKLAWESNVCQSELPTAPVAAGNMVFAADRNGVVTAFDTQGKQVWKSYTAGAVNYSPSIAKDRLFVGCSDGCVYAFAAKTGKLLWKYRVAPKTNRILVFGKLVSGWPVAGGVAVEDETVYAAAGITHYDGTYVVALDAVTGKMKAYNDSSGQLSKESNNGISVQGNLAIVDGQLQFLGGGVYEKARYDLQSLQCMNEPRVQVTSQYRTAFYPFYPKYGKYLSIEYTCSDGNTLCLDASYDGSSFNNLALQPPGPEGKPRNPKEASRFAATWRRGKPKVKDIWTDKQNRRFTSYIVSGDQLLAAGHPDEKPDEPFLVAINIKDGKDLWKIPLPANAVKGGAAIDQNKNIYLTLENGQMLCFKPE